jgi:transcription termination/antitermination protein NusG
MLLHPRASWFALHVRSQREMQVGNALRLKGYEEFVPLCRTCDTMSHSALPGLPLFPGYVFCRICAGAKGLVVTTPGVIGIVAFGGIPAEIDSQELDSIRCLAKSRIPVNRCRYLNVGDRVRIEHGPLCGLSGILVRQSGHSRIVLSITLLLRSVFAEIDSASVRPLEDRIVVRGTGNS